MMSNTWLHDFKRNVTSQYGEDGILEKALETIGVTEKWCVEFGASDGKWNSNCYNLIANRSYSAVLIESNAKSARKLENRFRSRCDVVTLHQTVGIDEVSGLDTILADTPIPRNFDLLSIDIDGNDYHVWKALSVYRPKLICIEYNPTIANEIDFCQAADMSVSHGSSLLALQRLASDKGYELIAVTECNVVFVDVQYFELFGIEDNSLATFRPHNPHATHLFVGYDGRLFLRGNCCLLWHDITFDESDIQPLPKILRHQRAHYNKFQAFLYRWYLRMRRQRAA